MKFNAEQMKDLTEHQKLLLVNFTLVIAYCNTTSNAVENCYIEGANLLEIGKRNLNLSDDDIDFLYHFFLENDLY